MATQALAAPASGAESDRIRMTPATVTATMTAARHAKTSGGMITIGRIGGLWSSGVSTSPPGPRFENHTGSLSSASTSFPL